MEGNVPEIRLKGFTEPWVQRKLGEVAEFNPRSILPDSFEYVDLESVIGTELISHRTENKDTAPSRAQRLAKKGDVFFQMVRPYQMNNYLFDLPHENYVFSTGYAQLRPNIDSYFLLCLLHEKKFVAEVIDNCTGTSYPAINSTTLANIEIIISQDKGEQTSIGKFFRSLDETIILHKRKLDGLKELKKGYLQKMFPQTGETVPKMRFDGFTEPWNTKKLSELVTLTIREVSKPTEPYKRISVRSHAKGTFHQLVDDPSKIAMDSLYVVHENDLIVNITFAWEHAIAVATQQDHGLLVSRRFPTYVIDKSDVKFLRVLVTQESFRQKLELISPGGAGRNRVLNKSDFANLELLVPNINEQKTIGNFFYNLDNQITTQNQKVEQLKQLKAAYLQKMFV